MWRMSQPAMTTMPSQIRRKIRAEPRSGSANTSSAGTAAMTSEVRKTRMSLMCSWLSERYLASTRMTISLPISEGCTCGAGEVDPALGAVDLYTEGQNEEQRADKSEIHAGGALGKEAVVEARNEDASGDTDDGEGDLTRDRAAENVGAVRGLRGAAAVDEHETEGSQSQADEQQDVIKRPGFAPANH